ncbi:MAG: tetratricopeptide repeat protein [bacterium]|nr:tetratricopeptide repeat protein [bacterium]
MRNSSANLRRFALLALTVAILLALAATGQPAADIEMMLDNAGTYYDAGDYGEAAQTFERILETDSTNAEAISGYTYTLLALDERRALDYLKSEAAQNTGAFPEELNVELASLWYRRGKTEEAVELLDGNEGGPACALRGRIYLGESEYDPAVKELKTAYVRGVPEARFFLAEALIGGGRYEEAVEHLTAFIEDYPYLPEAYAALGEAYHRGGRFDEALEQYDIALGYDATCRRALANKGRLSYERGDYGSAIKLYNEALLVDPWDAEALYNLAQVYEEVDRSVARAKWTQFLEMHSANPREARRAEKAKEKLGLD